MIGIQGRRRNRHLGGRDAWRGDFSKAVERGLSRWFGLIVIHGSRARWRRSGERRVGNALIACGWDADALTGRAQSRVLAGDAGFAPVFLCGGRKRTLPTARPTAPGKGDAHQNDTTGGRFHDQGSFASEKAQGRSRRDTRAAPVRVRKGSGHSRGLRISPAKPGHGKNFFRIFFPAPDFFVKLGSVVVGSR